MYDIIKIEMSDLNKIIFNKLEDEIKNNEIKINRIDKS